MITSTKNMLNSRFDMEDLRLADVIDERLKHSCHTRVCLLVLALSYS